MTALSLFQEIFIVLPHFCMSDAYSGLIFLIFFYPMAKPTKGDAILPSALHLANEVDAQGLFFFFQTQQVQLT